MHLDIEPEPDGMLETGAEFIAWYENMLIPMAKSILTGSLKISESDAEACIKRAYLFMLRCLSFRHRI